MTRFFASFLLTLLSVAALAQSAKSKPAYDSVFAKKLGADTYGMKTYVMAFLKTGKVKIVDSTERVRLQMAHLQNIMRMADEGKLVVAGPFMDKESPRGIYIFNVGTLEEARKLTETDPAIKAGTLEMELRPWYGSAALMEVTRLHKMLEKKSVTE